MAIIKNDFDEYRKMVVFESLDSHSEKKWGVVI